MMNPEPVATTSSPPPPSELPENAGKGLEPEDDELIKYVNFPCCHPVDPNCPFDCCKSWNGLFPKYTEEVATGNGGFDFTWVALGTDPTTHEFQQGATFSHEFEYNFPATTGQHGHSAPFGFWDNFTGPGATEESSPGNSASATDDGLTRTSVIQPNPNLTQAKKKKAETIGRPKRKYVRRNKIGEPLPAVGKGKGKGGGGARGRIPRAPPTQSQAPPPKPTPAIIINLVLCSYCGKYCLGDNDLAQHVQTAHPEETIVQECSFCGEMCVGETKTAAHVKEFHVEHGPRPREAGPAECAEAE